MADAAAREKLGMVWELLYDARWQLPTTAVEELWRDALGKTAVMQVGTTLVCYQFSL